MERTSQLCHIIFSSSVDMNGENICSLLDVQLSENNILYTRWSCCVMLMILLTLVMAHNTFNPTVAAFIFYRVQILVDNEEGSHSFSKHLLSMPSESFQLCGTYFNTESKCGWMRFYTNSETVEVKKDKYHVQFAASSLRTHELPKPTVAFGP